ncbi:hypothetical protein LQW54_001806 [Pestalotiopsis sp. IQ-011]
MDGVSAAASAIAIVQAAGMLGTVAKSFYDIFISKDKDTRGNDAAERVKSVERFIEKIKVLQLAVGTSPQQPAPANNATVAPGSVPRQPGSGAVTAAATAAPTQSTISSAVIDSGLGDTLDQCEKQLGRLQEKIRKMVISKGANQWKQLWKTILLKMKETELTQLEVIIATLQGQLNALVMLAQFELTKNNVAHSHKAQDEAGRLLREIELRSQAHAATLVEMRGTMESTGIQIQQQTVALQRLTITPHLDRTASGLSGATTAVTGEPMEVDDSPPSAAALDIVHHPGWDIRECRSEDTAISRPILDCIKRWMNPKDQDASRVCIRASGNDRAHDLCNRVAEELTVAEGSLLYYNGLPKDGSPPAEEWYTMAHLVWWLTAQMRIPVPHTDGHMPSSGYQPDIDLLVDQLQKKNDLVYIVLYLPTESCQSDSDYKHSLINRLCAIKSSQARILLFADGKDNLALGNFGPNIFVIDDLIHHEQVLLAEWQLQNMEEEW